MDDFFANHVLQVMQGHNKACRATVEGALIKCHGYQTLRTSV